MDTAELKKEMIGWIKNLPDSDFAVAKAEIQRDDGSYHFKVNLKKWRNGGYTANANEHKRELITLKQ